MVVKINFIISADCFIHKKVLAIMQKHFTANMTSYQAKTG